jgi:hypothetical protein
MSLKEWIITKAVVKTIKESAMWKFLEGKKTILTCAAIAIFGGIDAMNAAGLTNIQIPAIVFSILGALGIWTRAVAKPK